MAAARPPTLLRSWALDAAACSPPATPRCTHSACSRQDCREDPRAAACCSALCWLARSTSVVDASASCGHRSRRLVAGYLRCRSVLKRQAFGGPTNREQMCCDALPTAKPRMRVKGPGSVF